MVFGRDDGQVSRRDQFLAALVAVIWGFNFVVIDWGMGDVPPLLFLAARFLAVIVPAVFLLPRPPVPWHVVAGVGLFMSLGQFGFLYVAMDVGMPPGLAGLVLQAQVVLTIVIAALALRERPTLPQSVGVALFLCLSAALMWAIGNVLSRGSGATGGLSLTVWSALVVPVPLIALSVVVDGPASLATGAAAFGWKAAVSTLYTAGLASLVGYGLFNTLLARNPSAAVVPWILLVPPVAMGSAWALLGEVPSGGELAGGAVLVLGVLVAQRSVSVPTRYRSAPHPQGSPAQPEPVAP
jgi:drug/metabolite transporter (DMT)-like permease